jgi:hypothetical protein
LFSLISATWFFAGSNDLHLLGFDKAWSFYAALHGLFLGWMFVGCLAFLSATSKNKIYLWSCYLVLACFLLVAFGINGVPIIKRVGLILLSLLIPLVIARYFFEQRNRTSRIFLTVSLLGICFSMALAIMNEFWPEFPRVLFGIPTMVLAHGFLNAVVVVPCFYFGIVCSSKFSHENAR